MAKYRNDSCIFRFSLCLPVEADVNPGFVVCLSVFRMNVIHHYSDLILL